MAVLLIAALTLLMSCSKEQYLYVSPSGDTARGALAIQKIKARTVILQMGTGNEASTTDNTKAGSRSGSAATAPHASAAAQTEKGGSPWWLYLLALVAGAVGWEYFSRKVPGKWLPWRVGAG